MCDDHSDARDLLGEMLRLRGYAVVSAEDGETAIEHLLSATVDVGLIDIGLPGLDGYQVAREVRSRRADGTPRLIALTGFGQDTHRAAALAAGFDAHLVKPATFEDIIRTVETLARPTPR